MRNTQWPKTGLWSPLWRTFKSYPTATHYIHPINECPAGRGKKRRRWGPSGQRRPAGRQGRRPLSHSVLLAGAQQSAGNGAVTPGIHWWEVLDPKHNPFATGPKKNLKIYAKNALKICKKCVIFWKNALWTMCVFRPPCHGKHIWSKCKVVIKQKLFYRSSTYFWSFWAPFRPCFHGIFGPLHAICLPLLFCWRYLAIKQGEQSTFLRISRIYPNRESHGTKG